MRKRIISIILLIMWAYLIFYLSDQPSEISGKLSSDVIRHTLFVNELTLNLIHNPLRELMHTIEFLVFALLFIYMLSQFNVKRIMTITFIVSIFYACFDEIHQYFVPGRAFEIIDIVLDCVGIIIALLLHFNFISCMYTEKDNLKEN